MKVDSERLFGIPFSICEIDPTLYNKKEIVADIKSNYLKNPIRNIGNIGRSDDNVHHSYSDWDNIKYNEVDFNKLFQIYKDILPQCLSYFNLDQSYSWNFYITNYCCMTEGGYISKHNHGSEDFVGIHYIQFDPEYHVQTEYVNEHPFINYQQQLRPDISSIVGDKNIYNSIYSNVWKFPIKEDEFHIVPGFLSHQVPIQPPCDKLRMTIVVNIRLKCQ